MALALGFLSLLRCFGILDRFGLASGFAGCWLLGKGSGWGIWGGFSRPVACGLWPVACGLWPVACGLWPVACGLWPVVPTFPFGSFFFLFS